MDIIVSHRVAAGMIVTASLVTLIDHHEAALDLSDPLSVKLIGEMFDVAKSHHRFLKEHHQLSVSILTMISNIHERNLDLKSHPQLLQRDWLLFSIRSFEIFCLSYCFMYHSDDTPHGASVCHLC